MSDKKHLYRSVGVHDFNDRKNSHPPCVYYSATLYVCWSTAWNMKSFQNFCQCKHSKESLTDRDTQITGVHDSLLGTSN